MTFLLDTNACIAVINGRPAQVRERLRREVEAGTEIGVSSVVAFELWYGVAKSARPQMNTERLQTFLAGPIDIAMFDDDDARRAGAVRADLERAGTPVGAYDLLIAAQALRRGATLVTANVSEFARISGLSWQDWAAPSA
jgi:tRNA(fMet)-specific endonuclease VapC